MLDSKGNLIGINTAIFTQTGEFYPLSVSIDIFVRLFLECCYVYLPIDSLHLTPVNSIFFFLRDTIGTSAGVGFAIPSTTVVKIVPQLIQFGKVCACF